MKKTALNRMAPLLACSLAGALVLTALACSSEDDPKDGPPSTIGTGCPALLCDASGNVKSGTASTGDEYAATAGCKFDDLGHCADGCMDRELVKLPGCSAGNACNVASRAELPPAVPSGVTSETSCSPTFEMLAETESCGGYPCLSRHSSGIGLPPFFCAVQRCDTDSDCPSAHFCRCVEQEISTGSYTSERWCVRKAE
ncbi:MAG: hypothetical protein LBM75_03470 [Myxococcales bacterium]|jgi:hypothetical protein|nr:hypothetical protein [Myxococcales bacterium]